MHLDRQPAVYVFEVERPLVFAECESIICVQALQFLLVAHNEDLNERQDEKMYSHFSIFSVLLSSKSFYLWFLFLLANDHHNIIIYYNNRVSKNGLKIDIQGWVLSRCVMT